jgi:hypothetical protein
MSSLTPDDARQYVERWKWVEEREIERWPRSPVRANSNSEIASRCGT